MYYFYLDKLLLPVAPPKLTLKINNQNKTYTLIDNGEINVLKKAGLTDISFEILLPNVQYPKSIATYKNGFQNAKYFLDRIEKLKTGQDPFSFKVVRTLPNGDLLFDTEKIVSLEDYDIEEDADNGFDVSVSVNLKEYQEYGTKTVTIKNSKATVKKSRKSTNSPASKLPQNYNVKSGDCLWNIAKYYYGDGSKYTKIQNANKAKVKNANSLTVGQTLTIPV
jgi:Uncharacterized protein containing LysM domain